MLGNTKYLSLFRFQEMPSGYILRTESSDSGDDQGGGGDWMAFTGYDESLMLLDGVENHRIHFFTQVLVMNSCRESGVVEEQNMIFCIDWLPESVPGMVD